MTATELGVIAAPGIYQISFETYLADPVPGGSLSSSGAKTLVNDCPAVFAYRREHGRPDKAAFDFGKAAHDEVLGDGIPVVVVDADDWRSKAAREARAEARAVGAAPVLRAEWETVQEMAAALRAHPIAGKLLDPERGAVEQSAFWIDQDSGIWCRARYDYLRQGPGRTLVADYKTTASANPRDFAKSVWNYGYAGQGAWYLDGVHALDLGDNPAFLLVAQERQPPYLVSVFELAGPALKIGAERNRRARALFAECSETGVWPGYSNEVELLDLPVFAERQHEQEALSW